VNDKTNNEKEIYKHSSTTSSRRTLQPVFVMREIISNLTHYQVNYPCHVSRVSRTLHVQKYTSCLSLSHIIPKAQSSTLRLVQPLSYLTILRNNRCISVTLLFFKRFTRTKTKWNYLSYRANITYTAKISIKCLPITYPSL
jgi:hypothetical protein